MSSCAQITCWRYFWHSFAKEEKCVCQWLKLFSLKTWHDSQACSGGFTIISVQNSRMAMTYDLWIDAHVIVPCLSVLPCSFVFHSSTKLGLGFFGQLISFSRFPTPILFLFLGQGPKKYYNTTISTCKILCHHHSPWNVCFVSSWHICFVWLHSIVDVRTHQLAPGCESHPRCGRVAFWW